MPLADLSLPRRLLAGGGPSTPDPRVLQAMAMPLIGQFDPVFTQIMDEVMQLARATFRTSNTRCFPVSGLAEAGLEALLNTLLEPGDRVAALGSDPFRRQVIDLAGRYAADAHELHPLDLGEWLAARPAQLVVVEHADQLSGAVRDLARLARVCHAHGALLLVEMTLTLGGCKVLLDDWGVDAAVAGVDHCLGAPPGLTLVTYSQQVETRMAARQSPPPTSYLDLRQLQAYWSPERLNHHTAPTSLVYGLREALRLVQLEGLEARRQRHARTGAALRAGLSALGFRAKLKPEHGALMLALVSPPDELDEAEAHRRLRDEYGTVVWRCGPDRLWCVGLLGADAEPDRVFAVLAAVEQVVASLGQHPVQPGAARRAAQHVYASDPYPSPPPLPGQREGVGGEDRKLKL